MVKAYRFSSTLIDYFITSGWIRDYTGRYTACLYAQNVLMIIVIVIWLPELIYRKYKEYRNGRTPTAV